MKIVAEEDRRQEEGGGERCVLVHNLGAAIGKQHPQSVHARIMLKIETRQGARVADINLTHQEARALGQTLLTEADLLQKDLA